MTRCTCDSHTLTEPGYVYCPVDHAVEDETRERCIEVLERDREVVTNAFSVVSDDLLRALDDAMLADDADAMVRVLRAVRRTAAEREYESKLKHGQYFGASKHRVQREILEAA